MDTEDNINRMIEEKTLKINELEKQEIKAVRN